ncbi:MAG: LysM peptidoglycan-binding domain-containing protein [Lachnospiraceae bacterium]|nr:LysM peptidoglycan-binding domain-containing protein [Lachnospiraceae bacterium]
MKKMCFRRCLTGVLSAALVMAGAPTVNAQAVESVEAAETETTEIPESSSTDMQEQVRAEIIGEPKVSECYEGMGAPVVTELTVRMTESAAELKLGTPEFEQNFTQSLRKADGTIAEADGDGNYPAGEYYYEFILKDSDFSLKVPCQVLSWNEMPELTFGEGITVEGGRKSYYQFTFEKEQRLQYYSDNATTMRLFDSEHNELDLKEEFFQNFKVSAGTYYIELQSSWEGHATFWLHIDYVATKISASVKEPFLWCFDGSLRKNGDKLIIETVREDGITQSFSYNETGGWIAGEGIFIAKVRNNATGEIYDSGEPLLPGNYMIFLEERKSGLTCEVPVEVISDPDVSQLTVGGTVQSNTKNSSMFYQVDLSEDGVYVFEANKLSKVDFCNVWADDITVTSWTTGAPVHLKAGKYYIRFYNNRNELDFTVNQYTDVSEVTLVQEEETAFDYGNWGYMVGQDLSGNKFVDNQPIVNIEGIAPGVMSYDWQFALELEDGSKKDTFFNSLLWQAYGFVQKVLNRDGSEAQTDNNGYLARGKYIARFSNDTATVDVPFRVGPTTEETLEKVAEAVSDAVNQNTDPQAALDVIIATVDREDLAIAMGAEDDKVRGILEALEKKYMESANVTVDSVVSDEVKDKIHNLNKEEIGLTGASFSAVAGSNHRVYLDVRLPETEIHLDEYQYAQNVQLDLTLFADDGKIENLATPLFITMPVPGSLHVDRLEILHIYENGYKEKVDFHRVDDKIAFVVTSFSTFVFGEKALSEPGETPEPTETPDAEETPQPVVTPEPEHTEEPSEEDDDEDEDSDDSATEEQTVSKSVKYNVVRGDNLSRIARMYGVTLAQLLHWNPQITNPNRIYPGQVIMLGESVGTNLIQNTQYHVVQKGDTLIGIAKNYKISLTELQRKNEGLFHQKYIFPGQKVNMK